MPGKKRGFFGGFFRRLGKSEKIKQQNGPDSTEVSWEETMETELEKNRAPQQKGDARSYLKTMEDQMSEAFVQYNESKTEYVAVTSYLTDIQKIDRMNEEERDIATDAAKRIIVCTKEREALRGRVIRISKDQYQMAEQYEDELPAIIKNFKANEDSLVLIKNDMRLLEGEKGSLVYEKDELKGIQKSFKTVTVMILTLMASLFALFAVIWMQTGVDMRVPIMVTLTGAAAAGCYIFLQSQNNKRVLLLNERKMNKAISLLNTAKIRYVNHTGALDYMKAKYHVANAMEMNYIWTQYMKAKEEEKRYLRNSQMLELYQGVLTTQMKKIELEDPEIWIYQPEALVDEREMVEIRHRLNERRGKLREQMEYNQGIILKYGKELSEFTEKEPGYLEKVVELLGKFGVTM